MKVVDIKFILFIIICIGIVIFSIIGKIYCNKHEAVCGFDRNIEENFNNLSESSEYYVVSTSAIIAAIG